jgi:hypothetical protein
MADDSIELKITATTADLQAQLAQVQSSIGSLSASVKSLGDQMAASGQTGTAALSAGLASAAGHATEARAQVANLSAELAAAAPAAADLGRTTAVAAKSIDDQIRLLDRQLQAGMQHYQALYAVGQISSAQRLQQEESLTKATYTTESGLIDQLAKLYEKDTVAFQTAEDRKTLIAQQQTAAIQRLRDQAAIEAKKQADQQAAAWQSSFREVEGAEDTFIRDMLSGRKSLNESIRSATQQLVQSEIMADAKWLTNKLLNNALGLASDKQTAQGGLLAHLLAETQKVNASVAADSTILSADSTSTAAGIGQQKAAASQSILVDAKNAAANVYNSVSAIPYVGWILAPPAAAAAFAAVAAFGSFEIGAATIPQNMSALLHAGEMVVPASFANSIRSGELTLGGPGGSPGGGGTSVGVAMNVTAVDAASFTTMANTYARQLAKIVVQQMNANPSLRPKY